MVIDRPPELASTLPASKGSDSAALSTNFEPALGPLAPFQVLLGLLKVRRASIDTADVQLGEVTQQDLGLCADAAADLEKFAATAKRQPIVDDVLELPGLAIAPILGGQRRAAVAVTGPRPGSCTLARMSVTSVGGGWVQLQTLHNCPGPPTTDPR